MCDDDSPAAATPAASAAARASFFFFCLRLCPKSCSRFDLDVLDACAARSRAMRRLRLTDGPTTSTNFLKLSSSPSTATILSPTCTRDAARRGQP